MNSRHWFVVLVVGLAVALVAGGMALLSSGTGVVAQHGGAGTDVAVVQSLAAPPALSMQVSQAGMTERGFWLVLDPARELKEILPALKRALIELKKAGVVVEIESTPRRRTPEAVAAVFVTGPANAYEVLSRLPGVLDAVDRLPPAPPAMGVQWATGMITGMIKEEGTGASIGGADIDVYDAVSFAYIGSTSAAANGLYQLEVTAPYSQAKVYAYRYSFVSEWYSDHMYFGEADAVSLEAGTLVTGIDLSLTPGGIISVTLDAEGDATLPAGVEVYVWDLPYWWVNYCRTDAAGHCAISVPPGQYKMSFYGGTWPGIVDEWYSDTNRFDSATAITVESGMTVEVRAEVGRAGAIVGQVTDEDSDVGLEGVWVEVHRLDGEGMDWTFTEGGWGGGAVGEYKVGGLRPGQYYVWFGAGYPLLYESEWYSNASKLALAMPITVTAGETATVDAALSPMTEIGTVTGTLTHDGGTPFNFDGVYVLFYDAETEISLFDHWFWGDGTTTAYSVTVPAGEYKIQFSGLVNNAYFPEWYDDAADWSTAEVISVPSGGLVPDVSADLDSRGEVDDYDYGCIAGTVTDGNGNPATKAAMVLYPENNPWPSYWSSSSSLDGSYKICDLYTGTYEVMFSVFPSVTTWYSNAVSREGAMTVSVRAYITVTGVDGTAGDTLGACISGQVVDLSGEPVPQAHVQVYDAAAPDVPIPAWFGQWGTDFGINGYADKDGGFVACGLDGGTYVIQGRDGGMIGRSRPSAAVPGEETDIGALVIGYWTYMPIMFRE